MEVIKEYDSESVTIYLNELAQHICDNNNDLWIVALIADKLKDKVDHIRSDDNNSVILMVSTLIDLFENNKLNSFSDYAIVTLKKFIDENVSGERLEKGFKLHHS